MDPFIGEIRIFAGRFEPKGWAFCNGQLLSVAQHRALYTILGTRYGGDGLNTFALPNLQGRAAMHAGAGPGLTPRILGEMSGASTVTLLPEQMPRHEHAVQVAVLGSTISPEGAVWASVPRGQTEAYADPDANLVSMSPQAVSPNGGNAPHENRQPFVTVNYIIALQGIHPIRP